MTVAPVLGHDRLPTGHDHPHARLVRWAVRLSAVCGATFALSIAALWTTYAVGVESAVEDTLLGLLLGIMALLGVLGSLAAFVAAIVAKVRRERWALLWLPLCVFPALLVVVVLGEAFWWE